MVFPPPAAPPEVLPEGVGELPPGGDGRPPLGNPPLGNPPLDSPLLGTEGDGMVGNGVIGAQATDRSRAGPVIPKNRKRLDI